MSRHRAQVDDDPGVPLGPVEPPVELIPPPVLDLDVPELRAVPAPRGTFQPTPRIYLDRVLVAQGTTGGAVRTPLLVDGVKVKWGRSEVLSQPDPANGTVTLFDPNGDWTRRQDLIGQAVRIAWVHPSIAAVNAGPVQGAATLREFTYFRGRVSDVELTRKRVTSRNGEQLDGLLVTLSLADTLTELGNRMIASAPWPVETLGARRNRIAALVTDLVNGVETRPYWDTPNVAAADVDNRSALDLLRELYDSTGADRMVYDPEPEPRGALTYLVRRDVYNSLGLAGLATNPERPWLVSMLPYQIGTVDGAAVYPSLDSRSLEWPRDGAVTKGLAQRVSRVQLTWPDQTKGNTTMVVGVPDVDEQVLGRRSLTVKSIIGWESWATVAAGDWRDYARREGSQWQLSAPFRLDTRRTGGFPDRYTAYLLLRGRESFQYLWLQRSVLPLYGFRPAFGIIGGTIEYRDGGWLVSCDVSPVATTKAPIALRWNEVQPADQAAASSPTRIVWAGGKSGGPRSLDPTLTWADIGYAVFGAGYTPTRTE